jgi:uroporphyrinogen-III synthase
MNILLTKKLPATNLDLIRSWGWDFVVMETLNVTPIDVREIPKAEAWVVSSRNSLGAVLKFINVTPGIIYCVGHWMKEELIKGGANSEIRSFENMKKLSVDLTEQEFKSILYFCGENHRLELEEGLKNSTAKISKVITHRSTMTFPVIKNNFEAVFVFSPRSAESLLKNNSFSSGTVFACIGSTTASYLKSRGITNTFTPSYPDSLILLEEFHKVTESRQATSSGPATS